MEKKVRYLMLLLCLFLFPIKAFALEGAVEEIDDNVVIEENNTDDLYAEDLIEIENPMKVLLGEESNNNDVGDELDPTKKTTEEEEEPSVGEEPKEEENNIESDGEEPTGENPTTGEEPSGEEPTILELEEFSLTGVKTDLVVGSDFSFGGSSGEPEKYTVVREEWAIYSGAGPTIASSDAAYNVELQASGKLLDAIEENKYYNYRAVLKFADGTTPASTMTAIINGTSYDASIFDYDEETNIAIIHVNIYKQAINPNAQYIDALDLLDVVLDAIAGKTPTFTATTKTEHITLVGERWEFYKMDVSPEGDNEHYIYANASNEELIDPNYDNKFDTFNTDNRYTYLVVVDTEEGYRLNFENEDTSYYKVTINGEQKDCEVSSELLDNGGMRYYIYVLFNVEPTVEEIEEAVVEETGEATSTYVYEEEEIEEVATLLVSKTESDEKDPKLEVRKDKQEKEAEEKDTSSNAGLIVFLIILIVIAIAIPITIYRKEQ
ncbi:MAG: hypothetical protein IKF71_01135 [Bacilli bacterium]|nr:hypothetical protein [Bacilli bacterium]